MNLGIEIAQARRRRALTQRELAEKCGCTVPAISNIERGMTYPRETRMLIGIASTMGISAGELLDRIEFDRRARIKAGTHT